MSSLKFGTSGLRGLVTDLVGAPSYDYACAFLRSRSAASIGERSLLIGRDLRASSAAIAATVAAAAAATGFQALDCGVLPTPALALEAMRRGAPAIMVTGSHIPEDRNGLKFYNPDGEITKADETAILAALERTSGKGQDNPTAAKPEPATLERYRQRYLDAFAPDCLAGMRIAVYQQSSVGRDLLVEVLAALGATPLPIGRSDIFVPIDTEAHRPQDVAFIRDATASAGFDALITTDGDADRPLVADGAGRILRGDVLGMIVARFVGADAVVVPVTAGSAVERTVGSAEVIRTRVGSPYVIEGMAQASAKGAKVVVGFEANGGFLLGSAIDRHGRPLSALPTRDALLPILATLVVARESGASVAAMVTALNAGETASDRLEHVPSEKSARLLQSFADETMLRTFLRPIGTPTSVNRLDGVRIMLDGDRTLHFRASGNAPELRCYAEAGTAAEAEDLVRWGLAAAASALA